MRILGIVQWTNHDKLGNPIAGVRPLVEIQKSQLRRIDAFEEFPTQGQAFWLNARAALEGALITFRADLNPGQKDKYRVIEPRPVLEVLDLRRFGNPSNVRTALAAGTRVRVPVGQVRALIWCMPDVLVGPVDLTRTPSGRLKLSGANLARVPVLTGIEPQRILVDRDERLVQLDECAPAGYVDWDEDAAVLRRALEAAVRVAKQSGRDGGQTKRQIEDAARALAEQGVGLDAQLDRYRLERALRLCADTDIVAGLASELVEKLGQHPATKAAFEDLTAKVRADVEQAARAELDEALARERAQLKEATDALSRTRSEVAAAERDLARLKGEFNELQSKVETVSKDAQAAIEARIRTALERPLEVLAEVSILRPLLGGNRGGIPVGNRDQKIVSSDWCRRRGQPIRDRVGLQRELTSAARAWGINPSLMLELHAAVVAGLMPVAIGAGALAVLASYAHAACGGRMFVLHVSPAVVQPLDLDEVPCGGLAAATEAARGVNGLSLIVLEGANRAPLEASVIPRLQMSDVARTDTSAATGARLAASLIAGATTVPVSSQLWSYAVAVYPEPEPASCAPRTLSMSSEIELSSELLAPGDVPLEQVEELLDTWPDCAELRPTLERFGAGLSRFYEGPRIAEALGRGLILPYIVTGLNTDEQDDAVCKAYGTDDAVGAAVRRLRRILC